jgi:hypothetical protein
MRPAPGDSAFYRATVRAVDTRNVAGAASTSQVVRVIRPWVGPPAPPINVDTITPDSLALFFNDERFSDFAMNDGDSVEVCAYAFVGTVRRLPRERPVWSSSNTEIVDYGGPGPSGEHCRMLIAVSPNGLSLEDLGVNRWAE